MVGPILIKGQIRVTLPLKSSPSAKHQKRQLENQDEHDKIQPAQKWQCSVSTASKNASLALKKRAHQHHKRQAQKRAMSTHMMIQMQSPAVDPFNTWPIQLTPDVPRMAQYFVQSWAPAHGCAFAIEGHSNPYLSLLWPVALQDAMYFEALISLCLASWLPSQGINSKQDRMFLYHRGTVVTRLRERLQSPEQCCDNATILTVATLGTIDYVTGDHSTAPSHIEGMRRMVNMRGGIEGNDPMEQLLKINIAAYESLWSFVTESTTPTEEKPTPQSLLHQGQLPTYMAHPFKPEVCTLLAKLPQGFCDLGLQGVFSLQMIKILSALHEKTLSTTFADGTMYALTPQSSVSSNINTTPIQPPDLVELVNDLSRLATLQTTLTEHLLCYGLLAYSYILRHLHFHDSFDAFYTGTVDILTQRCIRHSPETENLDRQCYLWASVVIGTTLMNLSCPSDNRFAVFEHLILNYDECQEWELLVSTIRRFFWNVDLEAMVRRSWEEAMAREKERQEQMSTRKAGEGSPEQQVIKVEEPSRPSRMRIRDVIL